VDVLTGAHAAVAILAALVGRFRAGEGAALEIALVEVGVASLVNVTQSALAGQPARRHGNAHPQIVPYQTFAARDGLLVVAVGNDGQWRRLCDALGLPALADDPRWARNPDRVLHREELVALLSTRFAAEPRALWLERLRAAHVPAGAVREMDEVVADPELRRRDFVRSSRLPDSGAAVELLATPWRVSGMRPALRLPPPALGAHTGEFAERFRRS
jgi:crotonobetainyl-CoA:carnitine CoA-transferase CaiB-like acyl-CoA transferase